MTREDFFKAYEHCIGKLEEADVVFNFVPHEYKLTDDIFEERNAIILSGGVTGIAFDALFRIKPLGKYLNVI